jgi:calcium channel MID1
MTSLANFYDQNARATYQAFNYSIEQIPCDTADDAQYSLAVTCDDCMAAYKHWLCAVTIPRCRDFSAQDTFLAPRNTNGSFINNTAPPSVNLNDASFSDANKSTSYMGRSRSPIIDAQVAPGPYKELLPCQGLCYKLVQSCPASLQFVCPLTGKGLERSYGSVTVAGISPGVMTCSEPGALWGVSTASGRRPSFAGVVLAAVAVIGAGLVGG